MDRFQNQSWPWRGGRRAGCDGRCPVAYLIDAWAYSPSITCVSDQAPNAVANTHGADAPNGLSLFDTSSWDATGLRYSVRPVLVQNCLRLGPFCGPRQSCRLGRASSSDELLKVSSGKFVRSVLEELLKVSSGKFVGSPSDFCGTHEKGHQMQVG